MSRDPIGSNQYQGAVKELKFYQVHLWNFAKTACKLGFKILFEIWCAFECIFSSFGNMKMYFRKFILKKKYKKGTISNLNNHNTLWSPEMLTHPESLNPGHSKSVKKN